MQPPHDGTPERTPGPHEHHERRDERHGALPFSHSLDTSEATTDADDAEIAAQCETQPPTIGASVWYEFTPLADAEILVDLTNSHYNVGVAVATGGPGSFVVVACREWSASFLAQAGVTYSILAFDYYADTFNGGWFDIAVREVQPPPPPPELDVAVDPVGTFNSSTGSATITGTVTCDDELGDAWMEVQVSQRVGRFTIRGYGWTSAPCTDTAQPWSIELVASDGVFKGGNVLSLISAVACGNAGCGHDSEEATVRLRR
jgi:hypothetical protein